MFDLDSRVGLNGSQSNWSFSTLFDETNKRFYVWLGDVTLDKFTKTTFLNIVNFAEKTGATQVILVLFRDHSQKGKKFISVFINTFYRSIPEALQSAGRSQSQQESHD